MKQHVCTHTHTHTNAKQSKTRMSSDTSVLSFIDACEGGSSLEAHKHSCTWCSVAHHPGCNTSRKNTVQVLHTQDPFYDSPCRIQDRPMIGTSGGITICAQNMGIVAGTRLRAETCRTVCRFGKHSSWKVPKETRSYLGIVWVRFKRNGNCVTLNTRPTNIKQPSCSQL